VSVGDIIGSGIDSFEIAVIVEGKSVVVGTRIGGEFGISGRARLGELGVGMWASP